MVNRLKFFKAVTTELTGPHYGGLLYLPGTEHRLGISDPFDYDPNGWCTAGLYVTSHPRVAARWGPVTLEVLKDPDAPLVKTTQRHKPTGVPLGVDSGSYAKYRTTGFKVIRIIGVTAYGHNEYDSEMKARVLTAKLNRTLEQHGLRPVQFTGRSLERLRDDRYQLWEVLDPNAVTVPSRPRSVVHEMTYEVTVQANREIGDVELSQHLAQLDGALAQWVKRVGWSRL